VERERAIRLRQSELNTMGLEAEASMLDSARQHRIRLQLLLPQLLS